MATKRIASREAKRIQPVLPRRALLQPFGSISGGKPHLPVLFLARLPAGSISSSEYRCKYIPAKHAIPVGLRFQLHPGVEGGTGIANEQLNRPTLLIHAQDPSFGCCWFSRPLDFGEVSGNPAVWMLEKTAPDTWLLALRRVSGELAAYHLKTKSHAFPLKLKKGRVSREFKKWPSTITIFWAV